MSQVYAVIMAGGRGERFWPLSTPEISKPFIRLTGESTLLQESVARLDPLVPPDHIFVSIGEKQSGIARNQLPQLPEDNFIIEPIGRDTSACLGYSALHIESRDPSGIMLALPADHFIGDPSAFRTALKKGIDNLPGATGIVLGIVPVRPDTGYGYIRAEKPAVSADAWPVVRFIEKPDEARASQFIRSGDFFWNSGIFIWANSVLLELFQEFQPAMYRSLCSLRPLIGRRDPQSECLRIFSAFERLSVDFAILEKVGGLRMIPCDFAWDDIGNWGSLARILPTDARRNLSIGPHVAVQSTDCIVYSDAGTVATLGVSGLVVVQAHGKVLVCPKEQSADLKRIVAALETAP
jgi:mannose-1-phosphate guanylyltransferase